MTIDNTFMIKKLQKLEEIYVAFSQFTKLPFVECDEETFDDQVHVFIEESNLQEFGKSYAGKKILLGGVKLQQSQMSGFYKTLYSIGANAIMLHEGETVTRIQLEDLEKGPDMEAFSKEKIPVINPSLQLSAIYFIQELRRPVKHDMQQLHDLEEEMIANFAKAKFIMAMEMLENPEEAQNPNRQIRLPYVKDKDGNVFQPIFSDFMEFQKHYRQNAAKMRMAPLSIGQLPKYMVKESKGFVINPAGFNLQLSGEQIDTIVKAFLETQQQ